jgi:hypothetical protein
VLDWRKRDCAVAVAELQQDRGADVRRSADPATTSPGEEPAGIDFVAQSRSEVNRSKPGNASGALITAHEPGGPAAGIVTVRRVITSRSAQLIIRRPTATGGRAANGSMLGMSATVAAMRVSRAAVSSAWPPPIEKPHTTIRPASTPCSVRAFRTAVCQSASCSGREIHPRGLPVLSPSGDSQTPVRRSRLLPTAGRIRGEGQFSTGLDSYPFR